MTFKLIVPMFPFTSGKLHLGHFRLYVIADIINNLYKQTGHQTQFPMGWDTLGLPSELASKRLNIPTKLYVSSTIKDMKKDIQRFCEFDWKHELQTDSQNYYKMTQLLFIHLYSNGYISKSKSVLNYDLELKTTVADELVKNNRSTISGNLVEKRMVDGYSFKVEKVVDELVSGLKNGELDWNSNIKKEQLEWIGKDSEEFEPSRLNTHKFSIDDNRIQNNIETELNARKMKIRDWSLSRQRKYGTPIPLINCPNCGPVINLNLPVLIESNLNTTCPNCKAPSKRETDTLDTFFDSCWYYLGYQLDLSNIELKLGNSTAELKRLLQKVKPVDVYLGGKEHTVGHLLYSRMICIALYQTGIIDFKEPFKKFVNIGLVRAKSFQTKDGYQRHSDLDSQKPQNLVVKIEKMSKSKLNGIEPQEIIEKYGLDACRLYIAYCAKVNDDVVWNEKGLAGMQRFLGNLDRISKKVLHSPPSANNDVESDISFARISKLLHDFKLNLAITELIKALKLVGKSQNARDFIQIVNLMYPIIPKSCTILLNRLSGKDNKDLP